MGQTSFSTEQGTSHQFHFCFYVEGEWNCGRDLVGQVMGLCARVHSPGKDSICVLMVLVRSILLFLQVLRYLV